MGTRNTICVYANDDYRVAQYAQWDGSPSGQGLMILRFLQNVNLKLFKTRVLNLTSVKPEYVRKLWESMGANSDLLVATNISESFAKRYPHLHRDCGADILTLIQSGLATEVFLSLDFILQSLCEWCYVIDLDHNTFEVYTHHRRDTLSKHETVYFHSLGVPLNRFADMLAHAQELDSVNATDFQNLSLVAAYSLATLPTEEAFLAIK